MSRRSIHDHRGSAGKSNKSAVRSGRHPRFAAGGDVSPVLKPKARLAFRIFAAFRAHPHINNVLTHISRAKLVEVEQSLNRILDPATTSDSLSPLEQNIVDLMCAKRGITGKILKPYFQAALHRLLEPHHAERLIRHIDALFIELEMEGTTTGTVSAPAKRTLTGVRQCQRHAAVNM